MRILLFAILTLTYLSSCGDKTISTSDEFEQVELPDGSLVSLNKESSISYSNSFDPRIVKLTGEAFFSVTEGDNPFQVVTENGEVTVLGTEFNVSSRLDKIVVEVKNGEVKLKTGKGKHSRGLKKGQSGIYIKGDTKIKGGRAKHKYKIWMGDMEIEFKTKGKKYKYGHKHMSKDMKKLEKEMDKGGKHLEKDIKKSSKKIEKDYGKKDYEKKGKSKGGKIKKLDIKGGKKPGKK